MMFGRFSDEIGQIAQFILRADPPGKSWFRSMQHQEGRKLEDEYNISVTKGIPILPAPNRARFERKSQNPSPNHNRPIDSKCPFSCARLSRRIMKTYND
jgi:hypothetical protein